ncbi:Uncharacterised protein [Vibrio cholerae]|nr:Uncharacterised protein [Vibrio cholerae]
MLFRFCMRIVEKEELITQATEHNPVRLFLTIKTVRANEQQHTGSLPYPLFKLGLRWRRINHTHILLGKLLAKILVH